MATTTLVQQYFTESAHRYPAKTAVVCRQHSLTYAELDALSNAHARRLKELGLERGSFVAFFMKKSVNSIVSLLSILKADCAYVPLDVNSSSHRIGEVLAATRSTHVIVDNENESRLLTMLGPDTNLIVHNIDRDPTSPSAPLDHANLSIDIAYTLFTSGSTGKPKGVMISHQMIVDYIEWCVDMYGITDQDVVANHAPLYFDNSTFDLYTTWKAGATLHLVPEELNLILSKLVSWLEDRAVTVFFCVPSVMTIVSKSGRLKPTSLPSMRHVIAAGEVLQTEVLRQWMTLLPHIQFTNMYGPTEITVDCTFHAVLTMPGEADVIPIGKPRPNMEVFVMLEDGSLSTAPGAEGEIIVRGTSVAYGYLNDPERTQAAFIQNPKHQLFHDPLYRTGDIARIAQDGTLLFVGRRDQQIKYMGNRIELGEIEAVLDRLDGVTEATVVFHDSPIVEEKCIGALICLSPSVTKEEVVEAMKRELPAYMVPRRVGVTDELPRTANGKADRRSAMNELFGGDS